MPEQAETKVMLARFVAAGFGSGWVPAAPGTFGSMVSLLPALLAVHFLGLEALFVLFVVFLPLACWSTFVALPVLEDKDPGWVVIDEWLGQWLTLLLILPLTGLTWWSVLLAFAGFRLFDIWKPGWVRRAEQAGPAWWSIHADDLVAALYAGFLAGAGFVLAMRAGLVT